MYPSRIIPYEDFIFVEIFSIRVPGCNGPVSVQRRFEIADSWKNDVASLPIIPERNHYGTPFVPAEVAVMLIQTGVLKIPAGASYSVQFAANGHYFDSAHDALEYVAKRWPDAMAMFNADLHRGLPLELSPERKAAFEENRERLQPWMDKAKAQRAQLAAAAQSNH